MKGRVLITSIIVFLSVLALINIEPKGITAEEKTTTAMQVEVASPQSPAAVNPPTDVGNHTLQPFEAKQEPGQTAAVAPVEVQSISSPAATIPPTEDQSISIPISTTPGLEVQTTPVPTVENPPVVPAKTVTKQPEEDKTQTEAAISPSKSKPNEATPKPAKVQPAAPVSTSASAQQQEMLGYINSARAEANLSPLTLDSELCQGAYLKSQDMAVNGYFSHTSPTYGSPFDMMKGLGITYRTAAENIARNGSVSGAHKALMNSSGHKANILNPAFNKIGLGFYQKGSDVFVTQWFTN